MGLVFILRRKAQAGRAERLAKAMRQRGLDVCAGLDYEPEPLRSAIGRRIVDEAALTVFVWQQADLADETYLDIVAYAAARRRLVQARLEPGPLPQALAGAPFAPETWLTNDAALADWCDEVVEYVQASPQRPWPYPIADEYAALSAMHKRGGTEAIERFLNDYPGGLFEDIARAELDDATQPVYEPTSIPSGADDASASVWRMQSRSVAPWLATAGLVAAAAVAVVLLNPGGFLRPAPETTTPALEAGAQTAPALEARAAPVLEPPSAIAAIAVGSDTAAPPTPQPIRVEAASVDVAQIDRAPARDLPTPASAALLPAFTPPAAETAVVRDISDLAPDLRTIVEQARRAQARALVESLRGGEGSSIASRGSGLYRGQRAAGEANGAGRAVWSNGDVYAGNWSGSRPEGYGVLDLSNGARFEGEFAGGAPTGRGVFWDAEGRRLTGDRLFAALVRARTHE